MERMMPMGAPPMTPLRWEKIEALWQVAQASSNGSVEGLAWEVQVERNEAGEVIQLVIRHAGCLMLVSIGQYHPVVCGAVDSFFSSNDALLQAMLDKNSKG